MKILVMRVVLSIPYSRSLKEKRSVVKAIKDRVWRKFRASISEVDALDSTKTAILGICYVSNSGTLLESINSKIVNFIDDSFPGLLEDSHHVIEDY